MRVGDRFAGLNSRVVPIRRRDAPNPQQVRSMNSKVDVIAASSERLPYPQDRSRYFGSVKKETLRLVFSFYSPDGNEIAMPIASMSAYLKQEFPWVEVLLEPVLILRDAEQYSPENYAKNH